MKLRSAVWVMAAIPATALLALGTPSCSSSSNKNVGQLATGCSINSDCDNPLICAFSLCHEQCTATRDCTAPQLCVKIGGNGVCELQSEVTCSPTVACKTGLVCEGTECRTPCATVGDCLSGQLCQQSACYDPGELDGSTGPTGDGGGSGNDSGSVGSDGSAESGPPVEAGPLGYAPSNLGSLAISDGGIPSAGDAAPIVGTDGGIDWSHAVDVDITTDCAATCLGLPILVTQGTTGMNPASLYVVKSLTVGSGTILALNGAASPYPVIIASLGDVDIQGAINVNGVFGTTAGAGGWPPGQQGNNGPQGPGAGGNGYNGTYPTSAAGGGSFCGTGGKGFGTGLIAPGGSTYGAAQNIPLLAGSAGGYASGTSYASYSGGAIQISSGTSIIVRGVGLINAGGAGSYGAGGSGGAILLEAPTVTIQGTLAANGGGGGNYSGSSVAGAGGTASSVPAPGAGGGGSGSAGTAIDGTPGQSPSADGGAPYGAGGGGAGFIRINSADGGAGVEAGTISPALSTSCASQGTLGQ